MDADEVPRSMCLNFWNLVFYWSTQFLLHVDNFYCPITKAKQCIFYSCPLLGARASHPDDPSSLLCSYLYNCLAYLGHYVTGIPQSWFFPPITIYQPLRLLLSCNPLGENLQIVTNIYICILEMVIFRYNPVTISQMNLIEVRHVLGSHGVIFQGYSLDRSNICYTLWATVGEGFQ